MSQPKISLSRRSFLTKSCLAAGTISALSAPRHTKAAPTQTASATHQGDRTPSSFGSRPFQLPFDVPQLFFDDSLISYQRKLVRRWLPAVVNPKPVLVGDQRWEEGDIGMYGSILPMPDGGYRMYYNGKGHTMVAYSSNGLEWQKPQLDISPWEGKPSNILLRYQSRGDWSVASISVIHDPEDQRYPFKMTSYQKPVDGQEGGLYVHRSIDGLHWEDIPGKRFEMGDRNTMMGSRINGKFIGYVRKKGFLSKYAGVRSMFYTESENFLDWTEPQLALAPDLQDEPDVEFYGMSVFLRHGWFIGLMDNWHADTDIRDVQLAFSRDGKNWQRPQPRTSFIAPTYDWNRCASDCAHNGPLFLNEQMAFYFGGSSTGHHKTTTLREEGVIGLASLELDRFCALEGTTDYGWVDTVPLIWPGGSLVVNADTRESFNSHPTKINGDLFVEVLDESGKQLPEWSGEKKRAIFRGNTHCREKISDGNVRWPGGRNLDEFSGHAIRLRFVMKHARLFTFEARRAA